MTYKPPYIITIQMNDTEICTYVRWHLCVSSNIRFIVLFYYTVEKTLEAIARKPTRLPRYTSRYRFSSVSFETLSLMKS